MQFQNIPYPFKNGVAIIRRRKYVGLMNTKGEVIAEPKFDEIKRFKNGYARFLQNKLWGIIDTKGHNISILDENSLLEFSKNG